MLLQGGGTVDEPTIEECIVSIVIACDPIVEYTAGNSFEREWIGDTF